MSESKLTPKQSRFVDEYLIDLNATQAAIRAGYSAKTARQIGEQNLSKVDVAAAIKERTDARARRTEITQDMVLTRWWQIATADPRKLIQYRRCACRYCYGAGHAYQWIDEGEYIEAYSAALKFSEANPDVPTVMPSNAGGYGFNPTLAPHARCPKCFGEGHGEAHAHDVRTIDDQSAALYAGVKITKDGFEVKMQDQGKALENVARHLGMFVEKSEVEHKGAVQVQEAPKLTKEEWMIAHGLGTTTRPAK